MHSVSPQILPKLLFSEQLSMQNLEPKQTALYYGQLEKRELGKPVRADAIGKSEMCLSSMPSEKHLIIHW